MKTPGADLALRLAFLAGGLGFLVVFLVLAEATAGWSAGWRLAVLLVPAGLAFAGLVAGAELRDPHPERTRYGALRRGELGAIDLGEDFWSDLARTESRSDASAPAAVFGVRRRNTIVTLVLTTATTAIALTAGHDAMGHPDLTEVGFIMVVLLAPSSYYLVRSMVRLVTASSSIRVDGEAIALGVGLGFASPVWLERSAVAAVVDARATTGHLHFVLDQATGYKLRANNLEQVDEVLRWFTTWWPETPIVTLETRTDAPPSFAQLAPTGGGDQPQHAPISADAQAARPPRRRAVDARRTLRRRSVQAGAAFLVAGVTMFVSGWWYLSQRADNDRLSTEGMAIAATIVDVHERRGPDRLEVRFEHDGVTYEHALSSGYFSNFSVDTIGNQLDVLFDPTNPVVLRTEDRRNLHELTGIALLGAGAVGLLGATSLATALQYGHTLANGRWERRRIHGLPRQRRTPASIVVEPAPSEPPLVMRGAAGLGRRTLDSTPAWLAVGRRHVVVLPDGPDELVITARLPSGSERTL